jgi:hypothetical protein
MMVSQGISTTQKIQDKAVSWQVHDMFWDLEGMIYVDFFHTL